MERKPTLGIRRGAWFGLAMLAATGLSSRAPLAADMPNACPVDGCTVEIVSAKRLGDEIQPIRLDFIVLWRVGSDSGIHVLPGTLGSGDSWCQRGLDRKPHAA